MTTSLPKIRFRDSQIEMAHGAGGIASRRLVEGLFAPLLFGTARTPLGDAAHVSINPESVVVASRNANCSPRFSNPVMRTIASAKSA